MLLTPEVLVTLAAVLVVVVLLLSLRARAARNCNSERPVSRGPANLRFVCAGCEVRFDHTRRTLGAWEKGTRRFYCNACHTKWRGSQPAQNNTTQSAGAGGSGRQERAPAGGSFSSARKDLHLTRSGSSGGCPRPSSLSQCPSLLHSWWCNMPNPSFKRTPEGAA